MVIWNPSENPVGRAVYGMTFTIVNFILTLCILLKSVFELNLRGYGYHVGFLTLIALYFIYKVNIKYFESKVLLHPELFELEKNNRKWFVTLGSVFLFGSFFLFGLSGKYHTYK